MSSREIMEFDVIIVGAGPSGLSCACKLKQINPEISVCVLEKGSEVGAHILAGSSFETRALQELFPNWQELNAPVTTKITKENVYLLITSKLGIKVPGFFVPKTLHNKGNYLISLGALCKWLAGQAESLGVDIFPGFAASSLLYDENNTVLGVITGDMGVDKDGNPKANFTQGMELRAKYTVIAEGSHGHLGKELLAKFNLATDPQNYGLGIKEIWEVPDAQFQQGLLLHTAGFPLSLTETGGGFMYHNSPNKIEIGLIVDLSYTNPHLSPFDEFQRFKHHPVISKYLKNGKRIAYGARSLTKGGFNCLPKFGIPGAVMIGCDLGTLNSSKIKGIHTAMKSGLLAGEAISEALGQNRSLDTLPEFEQLFKASWLYKELFSARNFTAAMHKFGFLFGSAFSFIEHNIFAGKLPFTLRDKPHPMKTINEAQPINYPKPDGVLSFDKASSVFLANIAHEEDQPCHLVLKDPEMPIKTNLPLFDEPAQRYCPAGVYEIIGDQENRYLQINAANCLHCKTCDIKDPSQNICWITPEGASGPNYVNM